MTESLLHKLAWGLGYQVWGLEAGFRVLGIRNYLRPHQGEDAVWTRKANSLPWRLLAPAAETLHGILSLAF